MVRSPNHSIPLSLDVGLRKRQLLHNTHFISRYVVSSSPESIVLSLPSCSQPFNLFHSHLCHIHSALLFMSLLFFIASLSFIFDPFSSFGHWSFCPSPRSPLSSLRLNSSISLLFPCLTFLISFFFLFFRICLGLVKRIWKKNNLSSLSFLFSISAWPLCRSLSLCLCLSLPYRSSSWAVCQVILNLRQPGGTHR